MRCRLNIRQKKSTFISLSKKCNKPFLLRIQMVVFTAQIFSPHAQHSNKQSKHVTHELRLTITQSLVAVHHLVSITGMTSCAEWCYAIYYHKYPHFHVAEYTMLIAYVSFSLVFYLLKPFSFSLSSTWNRESHIWVPMFSNIALLRTYRKFIVYCHQQYRW